MAIVTGAFLQITVLCINARKNTVNSIVLQFWTSIVYGFIGHNIALTSSPLRQNQMHVDCMNMM